MQYAVKPDLFFTTDVQQELAELEFKIVGTSELEVALVLVGLEEGLGKVPAFQALVHGIGTIPSGPHGRRDAASGEGVRVVGRIAHQGKTVQNVTLESTGNRYQPAYNLVYLGTREKLVQPFLGGFQDVLRVVPAEQESGAEVGDVRFLLRKTPDVAVVNNSVGRRGLPACQYGLLRLLPK